MFAPPVRARPAGVQIGRLGRTDRGSVLVAAESETGSSVAAAAPALAPPSGEQPEPTTGTTWWNLKYIVAGLIVLSAAVAIGVFLWRLKRKVLDWPTSTLVPLTTPLPSEAAAAAVSAATAGGGAHRKLGAAGTPPLWIYRPYSETLPANYYGAVNISRAWSATVRTNSSDYHEIVVYAYPLWEIVAATTTPLSGEFSLDFLAPGTYTVAVFSPNPIEGSMQMCRNEKRSRPADKTYRVTSAETAAYRNAAAESAVASLVPVDAEQLLRISSAPTFLWPPTRYTHVETVFAVVPEAAAVAFIVVPSYGYITEGGEEHLGPMLHEGAGFAIYRGIAATLESQNPESAAVMYISLTVAYPDISPASPVAVSPKTMVYIYDTGDDF